ncbi:uncharacterized protein DUF4369 [Maribacter vaceletii]|uniref:Uncharacterized protein DUF4369 n=1 Tax=Maribacter vaceletii TaxID=1206816 RepID=A0A495DS37_9FLAO|nr:DUF4369 domain-containing protein [Maribacter vaceletii]RKR06530.1 uncharacterized protein DUF4369 [Maribacter vaceletii]
MKKIALALTFTLLLISCGGDTQNTMTVTGNVKGLKKGDLYLQKFNDTLLITIDSLKVEGNGSFTFKTEVESPEIYNLYLKKEDHNDFNDRITFFGEPGNITINTSWDTFDRNAKITGSESNIKYKEYRKIMSDFSIKNIGIIQNAQNSKVALDSLQIDSVQKLSDKTIKRSYAYALNFALTNTNSTVAPYVALYEVPDANRIYLDSIYNSLTPEVSSSKYGNALKKYLDELPK